MRTAVFDARPFRGIRYVGTLQAARLAENAAFRGRGLLARFLDAVPQSWIGRRETAPAPVSNATRAAYRQAVRAMAEVEGDFVLHLAAVLHCVEHGPAGRIEGRTIAGAAAIARYLVPHAEGVLNMMLANEETADDWRESLLKRLSAATVSRDMKRARQFFRIGGKSQQKTPAKPGSSATLGASKRQAANRGDWRRSTP